VVKNLQIDEVSVTRRAANPLSKILMRKRDGRAASRGEFDKAVARLAASVKSIINDPSANKNEMLGRSFAQFLQHIGKLTKTRIPLVDAVALHKIFAEPRRKNLDVSVSPADDDEGYDNPDADDDDRAAAADEGHFLSGGGGTGDESTERARRAMKGSNNMQTHSEMLTDVVKKFGIHALAKSVAQGEVRVDEHTLTSLISDAAARSGVSFSRLFEATTPEGATLLKAIAVARDQQWLSRTTTKVATLQPTQVGGRDAQNIGNPKSALDQIEDLVATQRKNNPALSESQAWERVYTDPCNRKLAEREREENRPVATAW
jgi:hypothetical protein